MADRPISDRTAMRYMVTQTALFVLTLCHALLTWPVADALTLFVGGAVVAFVVEVPAIHAGLFTHYLRPRLAGVPLTILLAWPTVVYVSVSLGSLLVEGAVAVAATAAVIGTLADLAVEPSAIEDGAWEFHRAGVPGPWIREVPWWNAAGWLLVVFVTAMLPKWL